MIVRKITIGAIVILGVILTSIIFSVISNVDSDLDEGDTVIITVADREIMGHIYTIRGDGRYTLRYVNNIGDPKLERFKRFEFEKVTIVGEDAINNNN